MRSGGAQMYMAFNRNNRTNIYNDHNDNNNIKEPGI